MANHRYWKARAFRIYSAAEDLELSEFHLMSAADARLEGSATLTSSHTPTSGALSDLKDNDLGTKAVFAKTHVMSPGFFLKWDAGSNINVEYPKLGTGTSRGKFVYSFELWYSDDDVTYTLFRRYRQVRYPGAAAFTVKGYQKLLWGQLRGGFTRVRNFGVEMGCWNSDSAVGEKSCTSGVRQFEVTVDSNAVLVGIATQSLNPANHLGTDSGSWGYFAGSGNKYYNGANSAYGATFTAGDVIGVVVDFGAGTLTFYKNGVSQGTAYSSIPGEVWPAYAEGTNNGTERIGVLNGGGYTSFAYPIAGATPWEAVGPAQDFEHPLTIVMRKTPSQGQDRPAMANPAILRPKLGPHIDITFGGPGVVKGYVKEKENPEDLAVPVRRRVRLYNYRDGRLLKETWSDPSSGLYRFADLSMALVYYVTASDHTGDKDGVIHDRIMAEIEV